MFIGTGTLFALWFFTGNGWFLLLGIASFCIGA
jgi:hypothetical protein